MRSHQWHFQLAGLKLMASARILARRERAPFFGNRRQAEPMAKLLKDLPIESYDKSACNCPFALRHGDCQMLTGAHVVPARPTCVDFQYVSHGTGNTPWLVIENWHLLHNPGNCSI